MGNDWRIWASKAFKGVVVSLVAMGISVLAQLDAQCPGATLIIGGTPIAVKWVLDIVTNAAKHTGD